MAATGWLRERLGQCGMLLGAGLLLASVALPYWRVRVTAPQYPQGLGLTVYLNRLTGDVRELDILNHYIGMEPLAQAATTERRVAALGVTLAATLLVLAAFLPFRGAWLLALPAMLFPMAFAADLYRWLWHYGTHLDPKAPLRLPPFIPPLVGAGKIAQFQAFARFQTGFWLACLAASLTIAGSVARFQGLQKRSTPAQAKTGVGVLALLLLSVTGTAGNAHIWRVAPNSPLRLQEALRWARDGDTVLVQGGTHCGNFVVTRSVRLRGISHPVLDGNGKGTVVTLKAPGVTLQGFIIRNSGDVLSREDAGVLVEAPRCAVIGNRLEGVLFGIILRHAPNTVVRHNRLRGKALPPPRRGDLIKVWYSDGVRVVGNTAVGGRDLVFWFSRDLTVQQNTVKGGRYGVHFMYCDGALVEGNRLTHNAVGIYLMYSRNVRLRRNVSAGNRGPSGYGVGLKDMQHAIVIGNLIAGNRVGIFAEGAISSRFERNLIARNDVGVLLFPSAYANQFTDNSVVDNGEQVFSEGELPLNANRWRGNFWSDYVGYDADGDGIGDVPYKPVRLFERLTDRQSAARLFAFSLAASAIDFAARCFPLFAPQPQLVDPAPRMTPVTFDAAGAHPPLSLGWLAFGVLCLSIVAFLWCCPQRREVGKAETLTSEPNCVGDAIAVHRLTKRFGNAVAVKEVSFRVTDGEAVALWGANGAGKTTVLRCLLGMLAFDGAVRVKGHDPRVEGKRVRWLVGYVPQDIRLRTDWTVAETLSFYAGLRKVPAERVMTVMEEWRLQEIAPETVGSLSGGMRQRLAFALALLADPPILLLDEPTANLDAPTRREVWSSIQRLKRQGKTVVFCSHRTDEVRYLADRILVLERGALVAMGTPQELRHRLRRWVTLKLLIAEPQRLAAATLLRRYGFAPTPNGAFLLVPVAEDQKIEPLRILTAANIAVTDFELSEGGEKP